MRNTRTKELGFTLSELVMAAIVALGAIGWIMNLVKVFGESFSPLSAWAVVRCIGIPFAPLGAVIGWF